MESLRQIGVGFLLALLSIVVIVGAFALSVAEAGTNAAPATAVPVYSPTSPQVVITIFPAVQLPTDTLLPGATELPTDTPFPTPVPTSTNTPPPPPTSCLPPAGWRAIVVQSSDSLNYLAQVYRTTPALLRQGNCLASDQLVQGSYLYVPPLPTATLVPCGAPAGWVNYLVLPGDTLYNLSQRYRVTVAELQRANCLGSSTFIQAGKPIKVPNVATSTQPVPPTPYPTDTQEILPTATDTLVVVPTDTLVVPADTPQQ